MLTLNSIEITRKSVKIGQNYEHLSSVCFLTQCKAN